MHNRPTPRLRLTSAGRSRTALAALLALGAAGCGDSLGPDGQKEQIVFLRHVGASASTSSDIYRVNADGSGLAKLTTLPVTHLNLTPSPDGRRIAYESDRDRTGLPRVWVMNTDGTSPRPLTTGREYMPRWSPDGTRLAVTITTPEGIHVQIMGADGGNPLNLTAPALAAGAMGERCDPPPRTGISLIGWLPDGRVAFWRFDCARPRWYTIHADGGGLAETDIDLRAAAWSPDGSRVVFTPFGRGLRVMNADGSGARDLTGEVADQRLPDPAAGHSPWSPDGRRLLFFGEPPAGDAGAGGCTGAGTVAPYVIDADGSGLRRLGNICGEFHGWSPSGDRIAMTSVQNGASDVYLVRVDDGEAVNLTRSPEAETSVSWLRRR